MITALKRYFQVLLPIAATGIIFLLIISKSAIASQGVMNGLKICSNVIIPSLFPFMVFSSFVVKSGIYTKIGKIIGKPIKLIFNLPACSAGAIIMGFTGGYPIGISMTAELYRLGAINKKQAQRLTFFNINAGPAFVISAVGEAIYHNKNIGYILFASIALSSLTLGIFTGVFSRIRGEKEQDKSIIYQRTKLSEAFVSATESASKAILSACVWVVSFGVVISFLKALPFPSDINIILCGITEVSEGCSLSAGVFPISFTAALISFSGFCIFFQILPYIKEIGLNFRSFLLSRLVCAVLSFIYCTVIIRIFPISSEVFSNNITPLAHNFSISIPTTVCLILTCGLLIFEVDRSKKIC